jgi:quinoprotein glucose dehydrogenase
MWHLDDPHDPLQPAWTVPPLGKLGAGPSGFAYNATICLPDAFRGRFFLCNYTGNGGIETFRIQPKGAAFELVDPQDFLKPMSITDCDFGYDGKLYLSDFVGLDWNGATRGGRIYTVYDKQQVESGPIADLVRLFREGFRDRENDELAELLKHADMRVRLRAQWALAERGERAVGVFLAAIMPGGQRLLRLHGIWGLGQIGRKLPSVLGHLVPLLADGDPEVRTQAAKTLGDGLYTSAGEKLLPLLKDESLRVRFHAAIALGQLKHKTAADPLADLVKENANHDKHLRHAAVFALAEIGDQSAVQRLAGDKDPAVRLAALLVMRRWKDAGIARFLEDDETWIVTEAARAINDLPLDTATGKLAALAHQFSSGDSSSEMPDALARRIVNANFRLGGAAVEAVVGMAANSSLPVATRHDALMALLEWQSPPQRDRVTGNWRPLPGRDVQPLRLALQPRVEFLLAANSRDLAAEVLNLIAKLELKTDPAVLAGYLRKKENSLPTRIAALDALAVLKSSELPKLAEEVLGENLPEMRAAALRVIAKTDRQKALPLVAAVATGQSLTGGARPTVSEQQQAIALLGTESGVDPLPIPDVALEQWAHDKLPLATQLDWLEILSQRTEPAYAKMLRTWQASLGPPNSPQRQKMALVGGDASRGREIFFGNRQAQCSRCHKADGRGGDAGPELARWGHRTVSSEDIPSELVSDDADLRLRAYFLTSMLSPDHKIVPGFGSVTLRLADGRIVAGVLRAETNNEIQLETPDGQSLKISAAEIEARTQPKSAMPAMDKVLSLRELRDVVEYLTTLR